MCTTYTWSLIGGVKKSKIVKFEGPTDGVIGVALFIGILQNDIFRNKGGYELQKELCLEVVKLRISDNIRKIEDITFQLLILNKFRYYVGLFREFTDGWIR